MLTLDPTYGTQADAALRWRWPQLPPDPLVLPWSELPVLALDRDTPWLYCPIERDPQREGDGRAVLPRRELQRLRKVAAMGAPFQRLAVAHELDPDGAVRDLLPELQHGPRTCTDLVAKAVVGPPPAHPAVRRAARALDAVVRRPAVAAIATSIATVLDPIVFGVVGMPRTTDRELALWYPLAAWRW